jgi:hypothetical protein
MRIKLKMMKMKIKRMSHLKRKTMIKGEMTMVKTRKMIKKNRVKDHLTQESTKRYKEILGTASRHGKGAMSNMSSPASRSPARPRWRPAGDPRRAAPWQGG